MANFAPIRPDGWANGTFVLGSEFQSFDTELTKIWSGDGGNYAPSSPMTMSGATVNGVTFGLWLLGPTTFSATASVENLLGSGTRFTFADNDYFELVNDHSAAVRSLVTDFLEIAAVTDNSYGGDFGGSAGIRGVASSKAFSVRLHVHDQATLTQVAIAFTVRYAHGGGPPQFFPKFRVVAVALDGTKTPLATPAGGNGADANGWIAIPAVSAGAWYNAGAEQSFAYVCDTGQVVSTSTFVYVLEVVDESGDQTFPDVHATSGGSSTQTVWFSATSSFIGIADTRPS